MTDRREQVAKACIELGKARQAREITQEMLDYELAKLSLEILDDYLPRPMPSKPVTMLRFEQTPKSEIARLSKEEYTEMLEAYRVERENWKRSCNSIHADNRSNYQWLKQVLKSLESKGHDGAEKVRTVVYRHKEQRVIS